MSWKWICSRKDGVGMLIEVSAVGAASATSEQMMPLSAMWLSPGIKLAKFPFLSALALGVVLPLTISNTDHFPIWAFGPLALCNQALIGYLISSRILR
jgi:hypothetical protein